MNKLLFLMALGGFVGCDAVLNQEVKPFSAVQKTLYIAPQQVDCVGVGPQKCLLVRENLTEDWAFFYDDILGFSYQPGYLYAISVKRETRKTLPEDVSMYIWTLQKVIKKELVK